MCKKSNETQTAKDFTCKPTHSKSNPIETSMPEVRFRFPHFITELSALDIGPLTEPQHDHGPSGPSGSGASRMLRNVSTNSPTGRNSAATATHLYSPFSLTHYLTVYASHL